MLAVGIGAPELLIILAVVLLLFGASRLPKLAKSLGEAKREFEKGTGEAHDAKEARDSKDEPKKASSKDSSDT